MGQNEGIYPALGDDPDGDNRLSESGGGMQDARLMGHNRRDRFFLLLSEFTDKGQ